MQLDETGTNPLLSVVNQIIFESNLQKKLEATDTLINALDEDMLKKTDAKQYQIFLHKMFDDEEFMRQLNYNAQLKENIETSQEYYARDYMSSPDYAYDYKFEKKITHIKKKQQQFLGAILRELTKGVTFEV